MRDRGVQPSLRRPDRAPATPGRSAVLALAALAAAAAAALAAADTWPPEAHATPACTALDAEKVWRAYDDIYTGEAVSVEYPRGPAGGAEGETARVHFEVARTLKGSPEPASWHADMPARTNCAGGHCAEGADQYGPGTEIFYLGGFNGMHSPVSGACGVGSAEAGTRIGVPGMVFSYYRSLYGFSPPRDDPCGDPDHVLVVRERGGGRDGVACVRPSTAERLGWEPFDRGEWGQAHAPPAPEYGLPIVRAAQAHSWQAGGRAESPFSVSVSRLPAAGETAVVTASYGGSPEGGGPGRGSPYEAGVLLSPGLEFVGLEGAGSWRSHYPDGNGSVYSFEVPAGGAPHSFSATIRAVSEGYAEIAYAGELHSARIEMHVGEDAGLLVDDYHRMSSPLPDMSGFRDGWGKGGSGWGGGGPAWPAGEPAMPRFSK